MEEVVITSISELNQYLNNNSDGSTIISIVMEMEETEKREAVTPNERRI
jgi:hypothetical protein